MNKQNIKRLLRDLASYSIPSLRSLKKVRSISADLSAGTLAIDIGASYFPHVHWESVRQCPSSCWVAIDPNAHNLSYLNNWSLSYLSELITIPHGLSHTDGRRPLFVTNVDSGSSLLEPVINQDWLPRVDKSYFFPVKKHEILCYSLTTIFEKFCAAYKSYAVWIKLDTQGTEFSILEGFSDSYYHENVVVVESECTIQRVPIMSQAGKLSDVTSYLESFGFELVILDPIPIASRNRMAFPSKAKGVLNECDVVFMISPSLCITKRPLSHNLSLISAYCAYSLFDEAIHHLNRVLDHFSSDLPNSSRDLLYSLHSLLTKNDNNGFS